MDFEKATIKKTAVSTLPPWVEQGNEQCNSSSTSQFHNTHPSSHKSTSALLQHSSSSNGSEDYFGNQHASKSSSSTKPGINPSSNSIQHVTKDVTNGFTNGEPLSESTSSHGPISNSSIPRHSQKSLAEPYSSSNQSYQQQEWSVFATMSNVSTISGFSQKHDSLNHGTTTTTSPFVSTDSMKRSVPSPINGKGSNQKSKRPIMEMFNIKNSNKRNDKDIHPSTSTSTSEQPQQPQPALINSVENNNNTNENNENTAFIPDHHQVCTCTCPQHRRAGSNGGLSLSSASFKKRYQRELREASRGYPTGQCISSTTPPQETAWDEKDTDLPQTRGYNNTKNTAFNLEALKAFLNSPLFSNILKSLTTIASVSLFAISLSSLILTKNAGQDDQQQQHYAQLSNGNAALVVIVTLSLMTILYSCFTIFLESRRPPEGLDSSNSKPFIVIFSEIIASIVWAQLLSITIYIYTWTYGCTSDGRIQIEMIWKLNQADHDITDKLCRRQGAVIFLELLLVVLLIFNFYTHLAQNFKFIREVS